MFIAGYQGQLVCKSDGGDPNIVVRYGNSNGSQLAFYSSVFSSHRRIAAKHDLTSN